MGTGTRRIVAATAGAASVALLLGAVPTNGALATPGGSGGAVASGGRTTSWGLDRIDQRHRPLDGTYTPRSRGVGVTVYLIDTGLDTGHTQFGGRASIGKDLFGGDGSDCPDELAIGHGTFVAGIAGGARTGVANRARLVALKAVACGEGGAEPISRQRQRRLVVKALHWISRHGDRPGVVNMSLTFHRRSGKVDRAVRHVISAGFPVVAAAGNSNIDACTVSPAGIGKVITVAAADARDRSWRENAFSGTNHGRCVDLYAPGKSITSAVAGGGTYRYAGVGATSWATPFTAGVVAQYLQRKPAASPRKVTRWLLRRATPGEVRRTPARTTHRLLYAGHG